jgi:type I restriction enzyme R subunit
MKSNFHFLATEWPEVLEPAAKAESLAYSDPRAAGFYARRALEMAWRGSKNTMPPCGCRIRTA